MARSLPSTSPSLSASPSDFVGVGRADRPARAAKPGSRRRRRRCRRRSRPRSAPPGTEPGVPPVAALARQLAAALGLPNGVDDFQRRAAAVRGPRPRRTVVVGELGNNSAVGAPTAAPARRRWTDFPRTRRPPECSCHSATGTDRDSSPARALRRRPATPATGTCSRSRRRTPRRSSRSADCSRCAAR